VTAAVLPDGVTRGRDAFQAALSDALDRLHPRLRLVASYHRGWVDADGRPLESGGGKLLRPALALLGAEGVGAGADVAMPGAVASELVHDFSLLHDDLMDGDTERRHRPTAWVVFGLGPAVLAGDGLLSLAIDLLQEIETPGARRAEKILARAVSRLVHGQADDLDFETRQDVTVADYLAMAGGKTSALLAASASIGAALADAPLATVEGLADFGEHLGLAFQLVDDLLGLWGDPDVTGKPVLSDLRARKKSAPVVMALAAGGSGSGRLRAHLASSGDPGDAALRELAGIVVDLGGAAAVTAEIERRLALAENALSTIDITESVRADLVAAARYVTARDR
jgi:geranylgeranyl diphosphate synthase type I